MTELAIARRGCPLARTGSGSQPADAAPLSEDHRFERCLAEIANHAAGAAEGVFGPGSKVWELLREYHVPLFGVRAVLLQIAHPAISAAGMEHSNFRKAFVPRTQRTFSTIY